MRGAQCQATRVPRKPCAFPLFVACCAFLRGRRFLEPACGPRGIPPGRARLPLRHLLLGGSQRLRQQMRVTLLAVFIIASFFCAPSSSSDSTIGVPEAVRPRDHCSSAGRSFRRGHSTLLVRRNCVEAKYEEDFFRAAGPGEKSAPRGEPVSAMGTQQGKESWASIAKRNIGLHEDSDAEPRESDGAPTGASPQAARRHHGSTSSMATQTRGGSGGGTAGVASGLGWSQVVRGGYSDGGADVAGEARGPLPLPLSLPDSLRPRQSEPAACCPSFERGEGRGVSD